MKNTCLRPIFLSFGLSKFHVVKSLRQTACFNLFGAGSSLVTSTKAQLFERNKTVEDIEVGSKISRFFA